MQTVELIAAIIAVVGLVAYPIVIHLVERGMPQAAKEEAARVYFDEHGHWPDDD